MRTRTMRKIHIIGIGAGNPDYLTIQAINALNEVDVFFIPDKGAEKDDLKRLRTEICDRFVKNRTYRTVEVSIPQRNKSLSYKNDVADWHNAISERYEALLRDHLADGECGGFLVWGDPTLYDSTLRIIEALHERGLALDYDVIPGISSVQALAARHRVPLNQIGESVSIVPGRQVEDASPEGVGSLVVVLDGDHAYRRIDAESVDIFWGAYVGTDDECLVAGPLSEVIHEIDEIRQRKKDAKGWIMDTYLLRRRNGR